jgi:ubiquitin carboxyl-terminal hydrolase 14
LFKAQLFALTGVQNERQKVMLKGATLKDADWGNIKLKDVRIENFVKFPFI